jgi:hypothetical protein
MEVLDTIKKANSQLPKGFGESVQKVIDKIFNIQNAGMWSVPFHAEFGIKTDKDEEEEPLNPIVTPDKRIGDFTSDEDVPTRMIKKRKSNKKVSRQDLSEDEEDQGADGDVTENLESAEFQVPHDWQVSSIACVITFETCILSCTNYLLYSFKYTEKFRGNHEEKLGI